MARPSVKQQIIDAGLAELHARGYAACSVGDITKAAGAPKGSFYNHFASKEDFAVEAVRRFIYSIVADDPVPAGAGVERSSKSAIKTFVLCLAARRDCGDFIPADAGGLGQWVGGAGD